MRETAKLRGLITKRGTLEISHNLIRKAIQVYEDINRNR
jgi:hypothetical protein